MAFACATMPKKTTACSAIAVTASTRNAWRAGSKRRVLVRASATFSFYTAAARGFYAIPLADYFVLCWARSVCRADHAATR